MTVRRLLGVVFVLVAFCSVSFATTFEVPLDVCGHYEAGQWAPFEIDLGVVLSHVSRVRFVCEGTVTGGLDCESEPFSWSVKAYLDSARGSMVANGPIVGQRTYPNPELFEDSPVFSPLWGATWDFLLDGRASGRVGMSEVCRGPDAQPVLLPSARLTKATLIIEATIADDMAVHRVDAGATGGNDGSSWADAYNHLQDALAAASYGDEIRVAQGVYKPDKGLGCTPADRAATFHLKEGVAIRGGYAGYGRPDPDDRDVSTYQTILSGDLEGDDEEYMNSPSRAENSYHVVTASHTDANAVLDGFTITAGYANGLGNPNDSGGGMYITCGSPTVRNCTFSRNAAVYAGGIACRDDADPNVVDCTFVGNSVHGSGAGMYYWKSSPQLVRCTFAGNFARSGAGIMVYDSSPKLCNCVFVGNFAKENGGALYLNISEITLTNCTLSANRAGCYFGGGIYNHDANSDVFLTNCILWDNTDNGGPDESAQIHGGRPVADYCCVQGWTGKSDGCNSTGADPMFASCPSDGGDGWGVGNRSELGELLSLAENDDFGDLHLRSQAGRWDPETRIWLADDETSYCVDGGCPDSCVGQECWPHGRRVNMGAYGGTAEASMSTLDTAALADLNGDDVVNFPDFAGLIGMWGAKGPYLTADLDGSGVVGFDDLLIFTADWLAEIEPAPQPL